MGWMSIEWNRNSKFMCTVSIVLWNICTRVYVYVCVICHGIKCTYYCGSWLKSLKYIRFADPWHPLDSQTLQSASGRVGWRGRDRMFLQTAWAICISSYFKSLRRKLLKFWRELTNPFWDLLHRRKVIIFILQSDGGCYCSIWYFVHWQSTLPNNVHNRAMSWNSGSFQSLPQTHMAWYKSWSCALKTIVFFHSSSETLCTYYHQYFGSADVYSCLVSLVTVSRYQFGEDGKHHPPHMSNGLIFKALKKTIS